MSLIYLKIFSKIFFILYFFLKNYVKADSSDDHKYFFQLSPTDKPYFFNVYLPNGSLLTVNTTEGENPQIIENRNLNQKMYKNLSKVIVFNNSLLVKTCFGPNKIVEIKNEKNETLFLKNNNNRKDLSNIQFCYSTAIYNKKREEFEIITYWTENSNNKLLHKSITFNPNTKKSSEEYNLQTYIYEDTKKQKYIYKKNIFPKSCVLFRKTDIFCSFDFDVNNIYYGEYFVIETNNVFINNRDLDIIIVRSSSFDRLNNNYYKPISVGLELYELYDIYITEYHDSKTTRLISSLYKQNQYISQNYMYQDYRKYLGIYIDSYVEPKLFNHIVPNMNDLIILYLKGRKNGKMSLSMSRYNIIEDTKYYNKRNSLSLSNYYRDDICTQPKYIQSILYNSFINYTNKDKKIMSENKEIVYYKYQKDIFSFIACSVGDKVHYESKKIIMPQCMNDLDLINGLNYHTLNFQNNTLILDIYNDPKFLSLRDITIELMYDKFSYNFMDIELKSGDSDEFFNINSNKNATNITHIKFSINKKFYLPNKNSLSLSYRLRQNKTNDFSDTCSLTSSICHFDFDFNDNSIYNCSVDDCFSCSEPNICEKCNNLSIFGLILDEENNKCICNETYNFSIIPNKTIDMCVCKKGYSFYKDTKACKSNEELENGPYVINTTEIKSGIPIYDDCYELCKKCYRSDGTDKYMHCLDCIDGYTLNPKNNCVIPKTDETDEPNGPYISDNNINIISCEEEEIYEKHEWFSLGDYILEYKKINDCVLVFFSNGSLFFYSDKDNCTSITKTIKNCSNNDVTTTYYDDDLNRATQYDPKNEFITITDKKDNISFYLVNRQSQDRVSDIKLNDKCIKALKKNNSIPDDLDLLVYKADIRRNDTISTQIEYQFYNPVPKYINEKLDLGICQKKGSLRKLDDSDSDEIDSIILFVPINWNDEQREIVNYVYNENDIFMFDQNNKFYLDVCETFRTKNNSDIYLQDRKDYIYINESFCEDGCNLTDWKDDFNKTDKLVCKCQIKKSNKNFSSIKFSKEAIKDEFKEKFIFPNVLMMRCTNLIGKSPGLYLTIIIMKVYLIVYFTLRNTCCKCILNFLILTIPYYCGKLFRCCPCLKNKEKEKEKDKDKDKSKQQRKEKESVDVIPDNCCYKYFGCFLKYDIPFKILRLKINKFDDFPVDDDDGYELPHQFKGEKNENDSEKKENLNNESKEDDFSFDEINDKKSNKVSLNFGEEANKNKNNDSLSIEDNNLIDNGEENEINTNTKSNKLNNKEKKNDDLISNNNTENNDIEHKETNKNLIDNDNESNIEKNKKKTNNIINTYIRGESHEILISEEGYKNDIKKSNNQDISFDDNKTNNNKSFSNTQEQNDDKDKKEYNDTILSINKSKKSKNDNLIDKSNEKSIDSEKKEDKEDVIINVKNVKKDKSLKGALGNNKKRINMPVRTDVKKDTKDTKQLIEDNKSDNNKQNNENSDNLSVLNIAKNRNAYEVDSQVDISKFNANDIIENENEEKISERSEVFNNIFNLNNDLIIEKEEENKEDKKDEEKKEESLIEEDLDSSIEENRKKENEKSIVSIKNNFTNDSNNNSKNANPPKRHGTEENKDTNELDDNSDRNTERKLKSEVKKKKQIFKLIKNDSYVKDIYYCDKNGRHFFQIIKSFILNNSTLYFILKRKDDINDFFAKFTILILSICFYIIANLIFMLDSGMLHLYIHFFKGKDIQDYFTIKHFMFNLVVVPLIAITLISIFKCFISVREFIYVKYKDCKIIRKKYKSKKEIYLKYMKLHTIQTQLSKFKNKNLKNAKMIFCFGEAIIFITGYYATIFCNIYNNSLLCLTLNTFVSMLSSVPVYCVLIILSAILRNLGEKFKFHKLVILSGFLICNPIYPFFPCCNQLGCSCFKCYLRDNEEWKIEKENSDENKNKNNNNIINNNDDIVDN